MDAQTNDVTVSGRETGSQPSPPLRSLKLLPERR
jgi:hypothetical protein